MRAIAMPHQKAKGIYRKDLHLIIINIHWINFSKSTKTQYQIPLFQEIWWPTLAFCFSCCNKREHFGPETLPNFSGLFRGSYKGRHISHAPNPSPPQLPYKCWVQATYLKHFQCQQIAYLSDLPWQEEPRGERTDTRVSNSLASRHIFDHLSMGPKFLLLWLMLLCKQEVPYGIRCTKMKAFLLALPLLLRWFTYKAKNLVLPSPAESTLGGSAGVIAFSERHFMITVTHSHLKS